MLMRKAVFMILLFFVMAYGGYKVIFGSTMKNTFPFSEADAVELAFYRNAEIGSDLTQFGRIPLRKRITLNGQETQELFEILFKENCVIQSSAACYDPRHAFIFTKQKETVGIIEVCVECSRIQVTAGISAPTMCDGMVVKLERFLKSKQSD